MSVTNVIEICRERVMDVHYYSSLSLDYLLQGPLTLFLTGVTPHRSCNSRQSLTPIQDHLHYPGKFRTLITSSGRYLHYNRRDSSNLRKTT